MENMPDVSHWCGKINYQQMAKRVRSVCLKATQGVNYIDPTYKVNWKGFGDVGMARMPYHYYLAAVDPISQADWFCEVAAMGEYPYCVDVEDSSTKIPSDYAARLFLFLTRMVERTNRRPVIYTRWSYWSMYLAKAFWADLFPLWIAHYKLFSGPLVPLPWNPECWFGWQYTDRASGPLYGTEGKGLDMSAIYPEVLVDYDDPLPAVSMLSRIEEAYAPPEVSLSAWVQEKRIQRRPNSRFD